MLDLVLTGFIGLLLMMGFRRPFLWVLTYIYIDIVTPQKIGYFLLPKLQISLVAFLLAFLGWLAMDNKSGVRFSFRQGLMLFLLAYCGYTTIGADFPVEAASKWAWVWKGLVFAIFMPLALRTRLRIEAAVLVIVLSAATIIIGGGIKTALGGGGYGSLHLLVNDNSGLYESSTLAMLAIALIPLIWWLVRHGTIYPADARVKLFAAALVFACLIIQVGTATRTGLLCVGMLAILILRQVKRRMLYMSVLGLLAVISIPFLPASFTSRMSTIQSHQGDESASTRIEVWKWTWDYALKHPGGGGFDAFRGNTISYQKKQVDESGSLESVETTQIEDKGRAYHSAYFEMLGEQGWAGLAAWLMLQGLGVLQMELIRRKMRKSKAPHAAMTLGLAEALQQAHLIFLFGALFVGIAFQPLVLMLIALQIALVQQVARDKAAAAGATVRKTRARRPLAAVEST